MIAVLYKIQGSCTSTMQVGTTPTLMTGPQLRFPRPPFQAPKRSKLPTLILLAFFVAAIVTGILYFAGRLPFGQKKEKRKEQTSEDVGIWSVKITRPRSLGTDDDIHHLHISEIEVHRKSDDSLLSIECADPCVNAMGPEEGAEPAKVYDKDRVSTYHNKYSGQYDTDKSYYGTEDHFLHVVVKGVSNKGDVGKIVVHHSHPQKRRIVGAKIELLKDGKMIWQSTFSGETDEYRFTVT